MVQKRDLDIVKTFKKKLSKKFPVNKMILFGSRANGNASRWSDFDIIIVSEKFNGKKSFERGIGFYNYWKENLPVDFLCFTPEEFEKLKKKITIVRTALKEGIEV